MDAQEILDIVKAFFNAILAVFGALSGLFNKTGDAKDDPKSSESSSSEA